MEMNIFEAKNRFSEPKKNACQVIEELMAFADKHNIRNNGDSIKDMIEEGRA